jgi:hypothetical protein
VFGAAARNRSGLGSSGGGAAVAYWFHFRQRSDLRRRRSGRRWFGLLGVENGGIYIEEQIEVVIETSGENRGSPEMHLVCVGAR